MKGWQARGEVLDSDDDDELDLVAESSVRKKARVGETPSAGIESDAKRLPGDTSTRDAAEPDWFQPRLANTYGTESRVQAARMAEQNPSEQIEGLLEIGDNADDSISDTGASPPRSAALPSGLPKSHHIATEERMYEADPHTQSSDSEDLPDVRDLMNGRGEITHQTRLDEGSLSSGLSSPLSERSISPSPPDPTFHIPRTELVGRDVPSQRHDETLPDDVALSTVPSDVIETTQYGRRTFRERKAQQLHPYEYEKMLYQRQFRERGLRPVRVADRQEAVARERSSSDNEQDSWQPSQQVRSSQDRPSSELGELGDYDQVAPPNDSDDIAPASKRTAVAVIARGYKRRKLSHHRTVLNENTAPDTQVIDDFSVPPSPPPTSSGSNDNGGSGARPAIFRFPRGMTPNKHTQQPTPNVSSGVRSVHAESDDDKPPRSRLSTISRLRHAAIPIDSSTESSAADSEPDDDPDVRRLRRERKRIRGVLPASWLKIDFKAQQRQPSVSPAKRTEPRTESPEKAALQRGVAQRVDSRPPTSATQRAPIRILDSESDSGCDNDLSSYLSASKKRQSRLHFGINNATDGSASFIDDDDMEVDYVDAMLARASRPKSRASGPRKRQPRITDAFDSGQRQGQDFAEERRASRRATGLSPAPSRSKRRRPRQPTAQTSSAPLLSIIDVPADTPSESQSLPQFVKLAMRKARGQKNNGRHSPGRKHIRLATKQDTDDATAVLRAWREGTVVPRQQPSNTQRPLVGDKVAAPSAVHRHESSRVPLPEFSNNRQSRLPGSLRTSSAMPQTGARRLHLARSSMRQTRLDSVPSNDNGGIVDAAANSDARSPNSDPSNVDNQRKRQDSRPQLQYRGAQLESLESDFDQGHRAAAFERRMHVLTEHVSRRKARRTPAAPVQLQRFLYEGSLNEQLPCQSRAQSPDGRTREEDTGCSASPRTTSLVHRPRKRVAQRLDAEARQYRQPSEPVADVVTIEDDPPSAHQQAESEPILQGLGTFGARYAIDFDTLPLPLGTYFHESSFIGSGDFAASLDFAGRNLDVSTGRIRIHVDRDTLNLGIWNEEVAASLVRVPPAIADAVQSLEKGARMQSSQDSPDLVLANVDYLLRSTVRYFTRCLAFSDPVDRRACINSLQHLVEDIFAAISEPCLIVEANRHIQTRCLQYTAVLARQAVTLCDHATAAPELLDRSQSLFQKAARRLAERFVHAHLSELRTFYEDVRRATKREAGIRDTDTSICSVTVLQHVLKGSEHPSHSFWAILYQAMDVKMESLHSVSGFDRIWCSIFSVLPALELDAHGILQLGSRLNNVGEDWSLCKALLERLFRLYSASSAVPGATVNEYVRATLMRCFSLQDRWGWFRCEPILYSVSDFFSRRGLAQLHKEESLGSPSFLQELELRPSVEAHADDRSFHIFLKMLCSGLRSMHERAIYSNKKIGGIAWRFVPNHGRTHRRDDEIRQEDLDALRNHHDLLVAIYYASPPEHRIRINLIQNLVDHTNSHREACRLNVRAWRNLAAYQTSTGETVEWLYSLNTWFSELLSANIAQYRMARIEVEQDVASAAASGKPTVTLDAIERIITANQRQIAATITDALAAVKHALATANSLDVALGLARGTSFWQVFELFDPAVRKAFGIFDEAVEVIRTALATQKKFRTDDGSQIGSEDSQDYGDSTALQELASTQMPTVSAKDDILDIIHVPLEGFLSSVFGADGMLDDELLTKVVDVWTEVASSVVAQGKRTWQDYINSYNSEAWSQLRDTEQRRKYTPYFLARVAETGEIDLVETGILLFWLKCLVDREATLKFQHSLTNALLNREDGSPLLANLPFIRPRGGRYSISLYELRQCRLGVVSSVLSNMHQHLEETASVRSTSYQELRRTYADMLRQMMQAMKANYLEVQVASAAESADPSAQGDYTGFVQQVVSFLQQYTVEICPIDRFFTDSTAFPLPATDPTYVVGRLKSYVPKLGTSSKRKELAVFVQTVSERAAIDGQQQYLVDQLTAAITGVLETGEAQAPSLRHVLMTAVFPAYIDNAVSTTCSWILALPLVKACGRSIPDLLYNVKMEDQMSRQAALQTISVPIHCMLRVVETALPYPGQLMLPQVLLTLTTIFETARQSLTVLHHIARFSKQICLVDACKSFDACASSIQHLLSANEDMDPPDDCLVEPLVQMPWPETRAFSKQQFESNLKAWHARDGQHFVCRGTSSVEVVVDLDDQAEEQERLLEALRRYQQTYEAVLASRETGMSASMIPEEMIV